MKIKPALAFGLAVLATAAFSPRPARADDALQLSAAEGKAPLTLRITGPKKLLDLANGRFTKENGCGYTIDWGDLPGVTSPRGPVGEDCSMEFQHTYVQEALYNVKASIHHAGPGNQVITDWSGEATIRVVR